MRLGIYTHLHFVVVVQIKVITVCVTQHFKSFIFRVP